MLAPAPAPAVAAPAATPQAVVRASSPLRTLPQDSAPAFGHAYRDQVVRVTARLGDWERALRADGEQGWLPADDLGPLPACRPRALGRPSAGRLVCGWVLAARTDTWTTWDYPRRRSPNAPSRRHGTARLIGVLERVAGAFHRAHPDRRLLIGDLSRPHGGPFGPRYGGPGHASHQSGLDADVFYPRRDGRERPADRPAQVDVPLAREVIRRFGRSPVTQIMFVGCRRDYASASPKAERLCNGEHENHVHVRVR